MHRTYNAPMTIILNGHPFEIAEGSTLAELITHRQKSGHLITPVFAVERNKEVIPRKDLASVRLQAQDQINVAVLVGGG